MELLWINWGKIVLEIPYMTETFCLNCVASVVHEVFQ